MLDKIEEKLKKIHLIIAIVALIVAQFMTPIFGAFVDKNNAETTIINHENRITNLEEDAKTNRDILLEIRWNLRNHILQSGGEYIESTTPTSKSK